MTWKHGQGHLLQLIAVCSKICTLEYVSCTETHNIHIIIRFTVFYITTIFINTCSGLNTCTNIVYMWHVLHSFSFLATQLS